MKQLSKKQDDTFKPALDKMATDYVAVALNLPWKEYIKQSEESWEIEKPDENVIAQVEAVFIAATLDSPAKTVGAQQASVTKDRPGCESLEERRWEVLKPVLTCLSGIFDISFQQSE